MKLSRGGGVLILKAIQDPLKMFNIVVLLNFRCFRGAGISKDAN